MKSVAIITGVTGQDGSYLSELLLDKGYKVHGLLRRCSHVPTERIEHLIGHENFRLHYADLADGQNILSVLQSIRKLEDQIPDEIYNLAAQSHVHVSFLMPAYTASTDGMGALHLLEAIRILEWTKVTRYYQASTSELFGSTPPPQSEKTPFHPRSPYAVAKLFAYWTTINYRESYGMFAVNGILFNHESPRRGVSFVTRKVTRAVGQIIRGELDCVKLGNLSSLRDWGHALDFVEAMWLMLQQEEPRDLVIGTGEAHSVRELVREAFSCVDIDVDFIGEGVDEVGVDRKTNRVLVKVSPEYFRPAEVENLQSNPKLAQTFLQWKAKYNFKQLIEEMVLHDLGEEAHVY